MPTMLNRLLHIILFLALAATASAQNPYLQGKLQGGSGVPGTQSRSPLNSLERAANNLAGATILTDTYGNQRLALYVRIEDTCIHYTPAATGNTQNLSAFVEKCSTDSIWYIDWQGNGLFLGTAGATCDQDWLEISSNGCPDNINDSIYHQKYAAVGARLVWPTAEFLVSDSVGVQVTVLSGNRNTRLGFWDNFNQLYSTIDQAGASTVWYFNPTGEMRFVTAGGGTVQSPGAPFVNQFAIDPNDTPLPTVQAHLYPNTRTDTNTVENFIYTDPVGKLRSRPIDSLILIVSDSIFADTTLWANWYTTNGTTTNPLRIAQVQRSAWWRSNGTDADSVGFIRHQFGIATGSRSNLNKDSAAIYYIGSNANLAYFSAKRDSAIMAFSPFDEGEEINLLHSIIAADTGIVLRTSDVVARAIGIATDTMNWISSNDPTLMRVNLLSDGTYFFADSTKTVAIGQFPDFPSLNFSFFERGIFYDPDGDGIVSIMANGSNAKTVENLYSGGYSVLSTAANYADNGFSTGPAGFQLFYDENATFNFIGVNGEASGDEVKVSTRANLTDTYLDTTSVIEAYATTDGGRNARYVVMADYPALGGNQNLAAAYIGRSTVDASDILIRSDNLAFGVQQNKPGGNWFFDHFKIDLQSNDTTINTVSLYGRSYYFVNDRPSPTVGDTSFHFWAGVGSSQTNPGFMLLDDIRGPGGGENWYTSNGTTTDNTRIADVLETATWRSSDVTVDGVYPFRFELSGGGANEPEMMVWRFPSPNNDSLTLAQSDQEITFRSTNSLLLWSNNVLFGLGDSVQLGHLANVSSGDIVALAGTDGSPGNTRTLKSLEGTFNADVISWSAGSAGDKWEAVPANRTSIGTTAASLTLIDASTQEIVIDGVGGGTIALNYTPSVPSSGYTTYRHIYNTTAANTTVNTDQSWQFEDQSGDLGTSFILPPRTVATLIWMYNATASNARFFIVRTALAVNQFATLRPSTLAATTNNWSPTGWSTYSNQAVIFSGDGNFQTVTGFAAATRDGVTKDFYNNGTNCVVFAKQHTSSSAGNRLDVAKDVVFYPKMSATFRYDSVGADWELVNTNFDNVSFGNILNTDLRSNSGIFDDPFWDYNAFGGTNNKSVASSSSLPLRYFHLSTSTAATAYPTITSYTGEIWQRANGSYLRQFARIRLEDLSSASEDFDIRWGWTNGTIDTNTVEGAWISYQREENSGGFTLKTNNGSTTTTTNCGSAIAADTWYNLELIYYPYGEVTVFINGTRYTTTSTIPEAITTTPILQIDKDNGTTARILYYSAVELNYTNVSD